MLDFLIRGGHVIDPASHINGLRDVAVKDGRIVDLPSDPVARHVINAAGCYVFPGLIDAHTFLFPWQRFGRTAGLPDIHGSDHGVRCWNGWLVQLSGFP